MLLVIVSSILVISVILTICQIRVIFINRNTKFYNELGCDCRTGQGEKRMLWPPISALGEYPVNADKFLPQNENRTSLLSLLGLLTLLWEHRENNKPTGFSSRQVGKVSSLSHNYTTTRCSDTSFPLDSILHYRGKKFQEYPFPTHKPLCEGWVWLCVLVSLYRGTQTIPLYPVADSWGISKQPYTFCRLLRRGHDPCEKAAMEQYATIPAREWNTKERDLGRMQSLSTQFGEKVKYAFPQN